MIPENVKEILKKQHYAIVGKHSAVQVCRWTKKSLRDEGVCYKEKFYGIKSHLCCQMSPAVMWCPNRCLHCWRAVEMTIDNELNGKIDSPKEIIDGCIEAQRRLLQGFNIDKNSEKKKQLPTQLYISVNTSNEELYKKFHRSSKKDAWERLNKSLEIMTRLRNKTRTIFRMNLILDMNMLPEHAEEYAELIKKTNPMFVEIKGVMSVGFARQRIPYNKMPYNKDIMEFSKKMLNFLPEYKILDEKKESRVVLLGKDKADMKIKKGEI